MDGGRVRHIGTGLILLDQMRAVDKIRCEEIGGQCQRGPGRATSQFRVILEHSGETTCPTAHSWAVISAAQHRLVALSVFPLGNNPWLRHRIPAVGVREKRRLGI